MKISTIAQRTGLLATAGMLVIALLLTGCPSAAKKPAKQPSQPEAASSAKSAAKSQPAPKDEKQPAAEAATKAESPEKTLAEEFEQMGEKPRDFGPPLVDEPGSLVRLNPQQPVWLDRKNKQVVLQGEVCRAGYPLEFFATYSNRSYEAVVSVNVKPSTVHAGLLAAGAVPGHPAQFEPKFVPPSGTEIAIEIRWKDKDGKLQSTPAQNWVRNIKTKKTLDTNWVFAGSMFVTDETTGKRYYRADSGELICVLSLPSAMLDLPIRSYGAIESRLFEAFEEHLAPPGTPITLLLKPILPKKPGARNVKAKPVSKVVPLTNERRIEAEKKAIEIVQPWLTLVDQGQYTRSWEMASDYFRDAIDRRDFVKTLNATRKPLGEVKARELQSQQYTTSLPDAPDGQYVVVQYKTSFVNKKSATETVTPMLDKDKKWRISGYYIK